MVFQVHTTTFTVCEYVLSLMPSEQVCAEIVAWILVPLIIIEVHEFVVVTIYGVDHIVPSSFGWFQVNVLPDTIKFQNGSVPNASILCVIGGVGIGASSPVTGVGVGVGSAGVVLTHPTRKSVTKLIRKRVYFMRIIKN